MSRWNWGPHFKMNFKMTVIIACLILPVAAEVADQGLNRPRNEEWNKTAPQIQCIENRQYAHDGRCCNNCEAGTYVKTPCEKASEVGVCAPCEPRTYTEHATGMDRCLTCTPCHRDQEEIVPCTATQNAQCQCKRGSFCEMDKPCEVCKKCAKCKEDEEKVQNCTRTLNTVCRKKQSPISPIPTDPVTPTISSPTDATVPAVIFVMCVLVLIGIAAAVLWCWRRRRSGERTETPSDPSEEVKINMVDQCHGAPEEARDGRSAGEPRQESQPLLQETQVVHAKSVPVEDEDRGLGDSLPNTTNSSQTSLSAPPTVPSCGSSPRHSPAPNRLPVCQGERRIISLSGDDSLKKSFDIFEEFLELKIHKRFFRAIGLSDNMIENARAEDKVYELLKAWMQKQGREADINDLLNTLRDLDQKLSAENISLRAVEKGYYRYEDESN
ncbi:tumor necrosis factor receptor superfamily member 10B-like [Anguilla anguilla]|uniref:tumor necrosis factor receptor superfamily member 10B-like n=1 Tax=Anguilla anguilla TaxID=7936 RepID=UPI0015AE648A|nr:tumor necrosis factor receptor superfamily member 10B-like [Anguilla anguilla]